MSKITCIVCKKKISQDVLSPILETIGDYSDETMGPGRRLGRLAGRVLDTLYPTHPKCDACGSYIHDDCGITVLDHSAYSTGTIEHKFCCKQCAETNSTRFGQDRYCESCNDDISLVSHHLECEICKRIGHFECYKNNGESITHDGLHYIYPHLHKFEVHYSLCNACLDILQNKISGIKNKMEGWAGGTRGEYIRGYNIIKTIGRIDYNGVECSEPVQVEDMLKIMAVQLGGNAYTGFFWDKQTTRDEEKCLAGYSEHGNPYYKTKYRTEKWFTGYATAVVVVRHRNSG